MTRAIAVVPNPEGAWARSRSLPEITAGFLDAHLGQWPELLGRRWAVLGGGLRSLNLRSGSLVARIPLEPEHDLRKEAALLRLVGPSVRVPRVIDVSAGALLLEHVPVRDLPATEEAGQSVGGCAAAIHSHRFAQAGLLDDRLEVAAPAQSAACLLEHWADGVAASAPGPPDPMSRQARRLFGEHAARLEAASASPVLVHSDFKPANVKWSPTERCAVVLDWEFAWAGPSLFDLGQMFRWNPPAPFVRGFERGYRAHGGALGDGWQEDAELFDLLNLIDFLGRQPADARRERDVRRRIEATLGRHDRPV